MPARNRRRRLAEMALSIGTLQSIGFTRSPRAEPYRDRPARVRCCPSLAGEYGLHRSHWLRLPHRQGQAQTCDEWRRVVLDRFADNRPCGAAHCVVRDPAQMFQNCGSGSRLCAALQTWCRSLQTIGGCDIGMKVGVQRRQLLRPADRVAALQPAAEQRQQQQVQMRCERPAVPPCLPVIGA